MRDSRLGTRHVDKPTAAVDELPHHIDGLLSIDHIALPADAEMLDAERPAAATAGARLSDHDAYTVTIA